MLEKIIIVISIKSLEIVGVFDHINITFFIGHIFLFGIKSFKFGFNCNSCNILLFHRSKSDFQEEPKDKINEYTTNNDNNPQNFREESKQSKIVLCYIEIHFVSPCGLDGDTGPKSDSTNNSENEHDRASYDDADPLINISRYLLNKK
jgi:hypothetical protein